jgi:hypothetical protein
MPSIARGTDGSNPSPSSGESAANHSVLRRSQSQYYDHAVRDLAAAERLVPGKAEPDAIAFRDALEHAAGKPLKIISATTVAWRRFVARINIRAGVVRLTYRDQRSPKQDARSHCRHRIPPFARRFGSKDPQR